jgi:hypothetical protein
MDHPGVNDTLPRLSALEKLYRPLLRLSTLTAPIEPSETP